VQGAMVNSTALMGVIFFCVLYFFSGERETCVYFFK
jgi:hypothetical protein